MRMLLAALFGAVGPWAVADAVLQPIVVRGDRAPGFPASPVSEFQGQNVALDARGETSLVRVLSRRASVVLQRSGGDDGHTAVALRGQDPQQTRFFLQGVPLTDAQHHAAQVGWYPAEAVASLDLFPEGSPAVWGSDGLGGALSLNLPVPGSVPTLAGLRFGSFGARRLFGRVSTRGALPFSLFVEGAQAQEDFPYRDDAGTPLQPADDRVLARQHNAQRWLSVLPHVTLWSNAGGSAEAFSFHSLRRGEIPGAVGVDLRGDLDTRYHLVGVRARGFGRVEWETVLYGWSLAQDFSTEQTVSALQIRRSDSGSFGGRIAIRDRGWEAGLGVSEDRAFCATDVKTTSAVRRVLPVSLSGQVALTPRLTVKPAVLAQGFFYEGDVQRRSLVLSPRMGVEWMPHPLHRVRASAGRYHRAPSLTELFGSPSTVAPSPELRDEHAWKAEAGWDARFPVRHWLVQEWQASFTFSAAFAQDQIVLVPNSQLSFVAQNIGRSRILTPEIGVDAKLGSQVALRWNGAMLFARNESDSPVYQGKQLPLRPTYRGGWEAEWSAGAWKLTYSLQATGAMYADATNSRSIGAFWEHGLWSSWASKRWGTWILEGRNLTDAMTVAGSDWNFALNQNTTGLAGFPAPGRRVYLTWRYEL